MRETPVQSLGWEDPLEKGMATHSSILAWRILWTEEPGGLKPKDSQRVRHYWVTNTFILLRLMSLNLYPLTLFLNISPTYPVECSAPLTQHVQKGTLSLSFLPTPAPVPPQHPLPPRRTSDYWSSNFLSIYFIWDFSQSHLLMGPWVTHVLLCLSEFWNTVSKICKTYQLLFIFQHPLEITPSVKPSLKALDSAGCLSESYYPWISHHNILLMTLYRLFTCLPPPSDCKPLEGRSFVPLFIFLSQEPSTVPGT